ncbi:MAG: glycosyltransferase family 2 protein [Candidatus Riflebacteria bacterium]|nr:glycosyltransferase family 2 protein [Candidatus Riflebacteria bacterium]
MSPRPKPRPPENGRPLVTIAVPLYRSRPFTDRIVQNLEACNYPNLEILISDRHQTDDALEVLSRRLSHLPSVRFLADTDGLDWVAHYNWLMQLGRGTYFIWMPHDDEFPGDYVGRLVDALEQDPEAVLAFPRLVPVEDPGGHALDPAGLHLLPPLERPWRQQFAIRLRHHGHLAIAFRGLFRLDTIRGRGLLIEPTRGNVTADLYWVFGVALLGPLVFVSTCWTRKHYHPGSAHAVWRYTVRDHLSGLAVLLRYVLRHGRGWRSKVPLAAFVVAWKLGAVLRKLLPFRRP